ncbi:MAG: hypothetical protein WCO68_05865 [Verrucomicrobiota bacterium]
MNTPFLASPEIPEPTASPSPGDYYDPEAADGYHAFTEYLDSLDWRPGDTKHVQQYQGFLRAAALGIDPKVAYAMVLSRIVGAGGQLLSYQLERQLHRAFLYIAQQHGRGAAYTSVASTIPKPVFSPELLKRIASAVKIPDIVKFIKSQSAIPVDSATSETFLRSLYPGEKVIVFTKFQSQGQFVFGDPDQDSTLPQGGPEGVWYLTNPADGLYHPNMREQNKPSRRSEESITTWRFMVVESDVADPEDWLRAAVQLPLPIVAIYTSGGKSIHCLVRVDAGSKTEWDKIKNDIKPVLVTLGADPAALSAVRLSRLPQCWRGAKKQELLYLNPDADGTPIIQMAEKGRSSQAEAPSPIPHEPKGDTHA